MPAGAARNALDCALWDLEAKQLGIPAHQLAGLHRIAPVTTAYTISVGTPSDMAREAAAQNERPLLKIKLGGDGDGERIAAVREAAPFAELIVDANEAWTDALLPALFDVCRAAHVRLIEQPLPQGKDAALCHRPRGIPVCADESVHELDDLQDLRDRYDAVNIKLDKAGGLTHAFEMARRAQDLGLSIIVGSMVGTSLAMAPAMLLAPLARFVDLDGPLLLKEDRKPGLRIEGSILFPPEPALWG
jgi:L-alanine-DL-glutamate epimerase-like enolase superfamily enzyme